MKAVIGHDGSPAAAGASRMAASLPWPADSELHVVRVATSAHQTESDRADLAEAATTLAGEGRNVATALVTGRPATVLRDRAMELQADLLILGARGLSPIRELLLGSVSAELIERAPCSVLVARGEGYERLVVGTDGSPAATAMPRVICAWELFRGSSALVIGVAADGHSDADRPAHRELALATRRLAARLDTCGLLTADEVRAGDPAEVLIDVAGHEAADILVVGPRGRSRVADLLLGSVARKVVRHAPCSVLVVRDPAGIR
ncbi:MAG TPA: universal stress protein [Candidatus Limnocylindria bacterium]